MRRIIKSKTLYTCLKDVADYVPYERQVDVTLKIIQYWIENDALPLLLIGTDWGGTKELRKLEEFLKRQGLCERADYLILPINMTRYLGDPNDHDMERFIRYEAGEPQEDGEYRIITTHPAAIRRLQRECGRRGRFGKTILVEDWGNSYTGIFGFYKWAADAYRDDFLRTKSVSTLVIKDFRGASQYAILRHTPDDGKKYSNIIEMMRERAPKLLKYLMENSFTEVIEEKPEVDLAVDIETIKNLEEGEKILDPWTMEMLRFIGEMAKLR